MTKGKSERFILNNIHNRYEVLFDVVKVLLFYITNTSHICLEVDQLIVVDLE